MKVTKKKAKIVPVHVMKPYGGDEEKRHIFLTSVPNGMGGEFHYSDRPDEICPDTH